MRTILISPHCDDETLFASGVVLKYRPTVAVVFDSPTLMARRRAETIAALDILLGEDSRRFVKWLGFSEASNLDAIRPYIVESLKQFNDAHQVFAPAVEEGGNRQHNFVGELAVELFGDKLTGYMTYTNRGKSEGRRVEIEEAWWPARKLRALACYESQIINPATQPHFLRDQYEHYAL